MAKLPDLSSYSMDELAEIVTAANKRADELRQVKIKEIQAQKAALDAELAKLGGPKTSRASGEGRKRASPQFKWWDAQTKVGWTGRGAEPAWFAQKKADGEDMSKYEVGPNNPAPQR